ncbi:Predicted ATP-binding protein involved in virulence [Lentzea albidocapillata subsp. violacea]|uniref:Predicted ATP-binding protein involved in virulence n=1 Tax=Lentzea albidocapillata subsp. violacea TaxID=128104 RepID=A0A1G9I3D1_9PSEU|nr:AAA family ATPase [Lentzea albidocapillata]SDL19592.1 Predicted ATP-binding protein involved in virulence [Lentzea albidocapillata subsp. violacea]
MYVSQVKLRNIKGFHGAREVDLTLTRPDGSHAGWTVIAGRNGSGKSTLLQTIALTLGGPRAVFAVMPDYENWLTHGKDGAEAILRVYSDPDFDPVEPEITLFEQERVELTLSWGAQSVAGLRPSGLDKSQPGGWLYAAYGPFRRLTGAVRKTHYRVANILSLFNEDASLAEGVSWLIQQHLKALEGESGADDLKQSALRLLSDGLLPDDHKVEDVTSDGLWVTCGGNRFPLRETSDGYRTVTALVVDLLKQIHDAYGKLEVEGNTVIAPGVVIIDEVDAHLHVSWQQRIGGWLKAHFPNIQFIVTTHSPYICQAADPGGLIRLPGPEEQLPPHVVDQDLYERVVYGSGDDAVLTELFGLDSAYSARAEQLRKQLVELEVKVIAGKADEKEVQRYKELREKLTSSLTARADEVAARLHDA